MNLVAIAKVIGILWKVSKPVAERIIRDAEYRKISAELNRADHDLFIDQLHQTCDMEAWRGEDGGDSQGSAGEL
jgi:hypothetical protein